MKQPYGHALACARSCFPITLVSLLATTALAACGGSPRQNATNQASDIHKIQHVVVIMQENRSFDSYFGTYPGREPVGRFRLYPVSKVSDDIIDASSAWACLNIVEAF